MVLYVSLLMLSLGTIVQGAPRIIGGHDAPNHKYPYQISLRDRGGNHFCSGSIINQRWILTAAHCIKNRSVKSFSIVAGTNFLNETSDVYSPQIRAIHEKFEEFHQYDIALVRLDSNIVFTAFVQPIISLPNEDLQDYSKLAKFAGWGTTSVAIVANALQEIVVKILTIDQCKEQWSSVNDAHICTPSTFHEGICRGDSGGPLTVEDVQVGIASYTGTSCASMFADVYTRVWFYRKWIDDTLKRFSNPWE